MSSLSKLRYMLYEVVYDQLLNSKMIDKSEFTHQAFNTTAQVSQAAFNYKSTTL
jgi:hypothetical protein